MLSLTRKIDYALVALAFLGQRHDQGGGASSARQIADQFGLPLPMLMNLLKDLTHANIVVSTRGAHGGYALASAADRITLLDVITAIEGPVRLVQCADRPADERSGCPLSQRCPIRDPIRRLHERITGFFGQVTLADLIESKVDVPLERVGA